MQQLLPHFLHLPLSLYLLLLLLLPSTPHLLPLPSPPPPPPAIVSSSSTITTKAGVGVAGFGGTDGGLASNAQLNHPTRAVVDTAGNYYIADSLNNRIRKVTKSDGKISTVAGTGTAGLGADNVQGINSLVDTPLGVCLDPLGKILYVADTNNNRVRKLDLTSGFIDTFAGTGTAGATGDTGAAKLAQLNKPADCVVDANSAYLYIADTANSRIRKINLATNIITTFAGTGVAGFSGDNAQATAAQINNPYGVAIDTKTTKLLIADTGNHVIRSVDLGTTFITTVAGTPTAAGNTGDNGPATVAKLNAPKGVAYNPSSLAYYIADTSNNKIRQVDTNGQITTLAGVGTASFGGDGGPAANALLNLPSGVFCDNLAVVWVSDTYNDRVRTIG